MNKTIRLNNGKTIGNGCLPYIVAEANSSHNGNVALAEKMIEAAKEAGCDCIKFQSWTADTLYSRDYYLANPITERIIKKFSLSEESLVTLAQYCKSLGIDFCSTPYSRSEVDLLLDACKSPFIKIASMDINNLPFLEYIAKKGSAVVLSTGMADEQEIESAVRTLQANGCTNLCVLHCVSQYPTLPAQANIRNINWLQEKYPECAIGFSDHSAGPEIAIAATAFGVALIEKHLTLDKTAIGMDNQMAEEPQELAALVAGCQKAHLALGMFERVLSPDEIEQGKKMRRSIVAARDIPAGATLTLSDLDAKRPGSGISPSIISSIVGSTLLLGVKKDMIIKPEDIKQ